jgi:hypothetical protein
MAHFARFASIFAQQAGYRKHLMKEAAEKGYPLIRYANAMLAEDRWVSSPCCDHSAFYASQHCTR